MFKAIIGTAMAGIFITEKMIKEMYRKKMLRIDAINEEITAIGDSVRNIDETHAHLSPEERDEMRLDAVRQLSALSDELLKIV